MGIAAGGFLLMIGMTVLGACALALLNVFDISLLVDTAHILLFSATLLMIAVLDAIAVVLILCR